MQPYNDYVTTRCMHCSSSRQRRARGLAPRALLFTIYDASPPEWAHASLLAFCASRLHFPLKPHLEYDAFTVEDTPLPVTYFMLTRGWSQLLPRPTCLRKGAAGGDTHTVAFSVKRRHSRGYFHFCRSIVYSRYATSSSPPHDSRGKLVETPPRIYEASQLKIRPRGCTNTHAYRAAASTIPRRLTSRRIREGRIAL